MKYELPMNNSLGLQGSVSGMRSRVRCLEGCTQPQVTAVQRLGFLLTLLDSSLPCLHSCLPACSHNWKSEEEVRLHGTANMESERA